MGLTISGEEPPPRRPGTTDDFESLVSGFIESITGDREHPRAALVSTDGVVRAESGTGEPVGSPAVVVVTNARVIFVTADERTEPEERSVYYSEMAAVTVDRADTNRIEVTTKEAVTWRCTLSNANPEVLDAVSRHLRWVGRVRAQLLELQADTERAAAEIREHAAEMSWDDAQKSYQQARTALDRLIVTVQSATTMADETLAPELTDIERTLEKANARRYIERARSQLEVGRYLVEHGKYDRAADALLQARQFRRRAEGQRDAVRRPDAFAFGRQRELGEELERLQWELQEVGAEPVRQAQEAVRRAQRTDDTTTAVEYWETAIRRYDRMLDLDWWREIRETTEGRDKARGERDRAVGRLIEAHAEIATDRWQEGVSRHDRSNTPGAIDRFEDALAHLERARDLAVEFDRDNADALDAELREMRSTVERLRASATRRSSSASPQDGTADPEHTEGGQPAWDGETVCVRWVAFTDDLVRRWLPRPVSDVVEGMNHQVSDDIGRIGLPEGVLPDETDDSDTGG